MCTRRKEGETTTKRIDGGTHASYQTRDTTVTVRVCNTSRRVQATTELSSPGEWPIPGLTQDTGDSVSLSDLPLWPFQMMISS